MQFSSLFLQAAVAYAVAFPDVFDRETRTTVCSDERTIWLTKDVTQIITSTYYPTAPASTETTTEYVTVTDTYTQSCPGVDTVTITATPSPPAPSTVTVDCSGVETVTVTPPGTTWIQYATVTDTYTQSCPAAETVTITQ